ALRTLADAIAKASGSNLGYLTDGANAAGAWLAGAVPHRGVGGQTDDVLTGRALDEITGEKLAACLLVNIEPDTDAANAGALLKTLGDADFVVSVSAYNSASLKAVADVMLPAANYSETSGTYVNAEGFWQSFKGVMKARGEARPAWKVLRVLGNLTGLEGFDYLSSQDVKNEVRAQCENIELSNAVEAAKTVDVKAGEGLQRAGDVPMYAVDAVTRRAASLQKTVDAQTLCVRINSGEAARAGLGEATSVKVTQGENSAVLPLLIDESIPDASVWIASGLEGSDLLGEAFAGVTIESEG
ncbi:MAG TPA: NADH-quinone oxidoreductase subunit G, partial [Thiotrichales bacterium]|nr:NADH-quinone oxidoreductase subunit G [Thiotrichales bacterium]